MTKFGEYPVIRTPFGAGDRNIEMPDILNGISEKEACPYANGGTQISRHKMNGIGYIATLGAFLDRLGYPYGYVEGLSYPKGAIVSIYDDQNATMKEYINTIDNNTLSPDVFGDSIDPTDRVTNGWKAIHKVNSYSFFPDYSNRTLIKTIKTTSKNTSEETISPESGGWILATRIIEGWEEFDSAQRLGLGYSEVSVRLGVSSAYQYLSSDSFEIKHYEGGEASRFFPSPTIFPIRVYCPGWVKSVTLNIYHYPFERE